MNQIRMRRGFIILFFLPVIISASTSVPLKIRVKVEAGEVERDNTIASLDISSYSIPADKQVVVKGLDGKLSPCQVDSCLQTHSATLFFKVQGKMTVGESRIYSIETAPVTAKAPVMKVEKNRFGDLILKDDNLNVFQYNTSVARLPGYVDPAFRRNGYIHPVWSPAGNILTNVNPGDHMHHYGIWNPWTSVEYDGKHYDLWNIGDKTGAVRFDSLYSQASGELFADILVRHRHVIFQQMPEQHINTVWADIAVTPKVEKIIMNELQDLRVWNVSENAFLWDFNFTLYPSAELPVILKEYRYAGFGWRATPDWTKDNCEMMTSEGKSRPEIDGTNARWIYVTGISPKGKSGILFMASPKNHNFPEPLRIWDQTQNDGRGDAFINFAPTKNEDWILKPGSEYKFRYRLFVFDGDISPDKAEAIWKDYAEPVKVSVIK